MLLREDIKSNFLNLFTKAIENEPLENDNKLNVFVLKVANNRLDYGALTEELQNALIFYALSRRTVDELIEHRRYGNMASYAKEKLRKADQNKGELGELLLYCLLESHLNAPKLLSKLELKTSPNDYVKGADGVHLLKLDEKSFQVVFGESKTRSGLETGIREAFASISTMLDNNVGGKMLFEKHLIGNNLLKENVSEDELCFLKKILIPSENDEDLAVDISFGVFLGFNLPITDDERKVSNSQFRSNIIDKVKKAVFDEIDMINSYLKEKDYVGYQFYFYVMPFDELDKIRTEIIKNLVS